MRIYWVGLLAVIMLMGVGCKGRGGVLDRSADWEQAYYRSGHRIVVDQFEIDTRNTRALSKVYGYRQDDVVISAQGDGLIQTLEGIELFPAKRSIREGLRNVTTQSTLRRTQQFSFQQRTHPPAYTVPLPSESAGYTTTASVGSSQILKLEDMALVLGPAENYEQGISIEARMVGAVIGGPGTFEVLDQPLFLEPGQTVAIRTAPTPGTISPLSFERGGQRFETVYLVTYVKVRDYVPTVRGVFSSRY